MITSGSAAQNQTQDYQNSVSNGPSDIITPTPIIPAPSHSSSSSSSSSSSDDSESSSSWDSSSSYAYWSSDSESVTVGPILIVALILSIILSLMISGFKVYSLALAFKMRRLLRCSSPLPVCSKSTGAHCSNATYPGGYSALPTSPVEMESPVQEEAPAVPQQQMPMMYMPYPYNMNPNQMQMQMPNGAGMPMMFNQYGQPVFYSYQPMNIQQPTTPQ